MTLTQKICCQFIFYWERVISQKLKIGACLRVGQSGEPFAKQNKMGWVLMSSGKDTECLFH